MDSARSLWRGVQSVEHWCARDLQRPSKAISQEEGNALAEVLFGDYNPGGKLVDTWPKSLEQLPPMMDFDLRDGRSTCISKGSRSTPLDSD